MDVEKEIRAADARVRASIERNTKESLARMDERWPSPYAVIVERPRDSMEAWGQAWGQLVRAFHDGVAAMAESFARGFTAIDRARAPGPTVPMMLIYGHESTAPSPTDHTNGRSER